MTEELSDYVAHTPDDRQLDLESLKALSHPLRVQLFETLATYGPHTASGLAERLGESSGATSYHLRQLEKHGFVREVEGRGTTRERWWERVPGGVSLVAEKVSDTAAGRAASRAVQRHWEDHRGQLLRDFTDHGLSELPPQWLAASELMTANLRLTPDQLAEIVREFSTFSNTVIEKYRGIHDPGSRPVQIHFNAFPVMDGEETPTDKETRS